MSPSVAQPQSPAVPSAPAAGRPAPALSGTSLRWGVGLFCSFIGAFMLVAPHQFAGPVYEPLRRLGVAWAIAALAAGGGLLSAATLRTRRGVRLLIHGLASLVLLALAASLAAAGAWSGLIAYMVLAGCLLTPAALRGRPARHPAGDLLALTMGLISILMGAMLALLPGLFHGPTSRFSSAPRPLGLLLLVSGLPICYVQLRTVPRWLLWAAHLAAGAGLVTLGVLAASPPPAWTGIALFWGVGGAVALLPWLREWWGGLDTSALRTRLALALATATCVSLVLAVAVSTTQEERLATAQASETLGVEARSVAQDVRDYVDLNGARATTMAALASQLPLDSELQRQLLGNSRPGYGDVAGMLLLGRDGRMVASDGGGVPEPPTLADVARATAAHAGVAVQLALDRASGHRLLLVAAPVFAHDGRPAATFIMELDSRSLERRIAREGSVVSLSDGYGNLLARRNGLTADGSRLPAGWDRQAAGGSLPELAGRLAAFAKVPDFSWIVAIERPVAASLSGVDRGRDLAFATLLVVLPLAVAGGILVARLITRPLGALADAVGELTAGNPWAPLESSRITEVERLSAAFREMRDRLAQRTVEGERLAAELRARAEALAESDRRKDEFLAMLAHELRNPLGAISTAAYILSQSRDLEPRVARSVAVIQRQSQHLARLVDDLLDVSRITRGKVELRRVPLDLVEVVKQAVETTRPLVEARRHHLEVSLPGEPLPLVADPTRIEQVLANLVRNAVKFTEPGGVLKVDAAARDGYGVVRVRDTGVGIPDELLPRVFDLFIQGQQGLDRSAGGLGIGLTLVRSLVEMHGGRVEARSDGPGAGSEFIVWLPLAPAAGPQLKTAFAAEHA
ncbi:MAG TPA: sensor histidine kinase [Thermoanaerobaculia bacterium]|nr:sensor histidine kinase [Thermoanaerobaculia bacterium]